MGAITKTFDSRELFNLLPFPSLMTFQLKNLYHTRVNRNQLFYEKKRGNLINAYLIEANIFIVSTLFPAARANRMLCPNHHAGTDNLYYFVVTVVVVLVVAPLTCIILFPYSLVLNKKRRKNNLVSSMEK